MSFSSVFAHSLFFLHCFASTDLCYRMLLCLCCLLCCCRLHLIFAAAVPCILHLCFTYSLDSHRQHVGVFVCHLLLPFEFSFSLVFASLSSHFRLMQCGRSPSTCLSFCLPPPFRVLLSSLCSLCYFCVLLTTHSLPFFPECKAHLTTAHSRCDEFFASHFPMWSSTSNSMSWYLLYLRGSTLIFPQHPLTATFLFFSPLNSFLSMFCRSDVFVPLHSLSLKHMKAYVMCLAGHLILTFSVDIAIFCNRLPHQLFNFLFSWVLHETLWLRLYYGAGLLEPCCILQFKFFLPPLSWKTFFSMLAIYFVHSVVPFVLHFLNGWVHSLYLERPSSWLDTFSRLFFSSKLSICSSVLLRSFPSFRLISSSVSDESISSFFFFHTTIILKDIRSLLMLQCCFPLLFSCVSTLFLGSRYKAGLSVSMSFFPLFQLFLFASCLLSHLMLIVFPLFVLTYTVMLGFPTRSLIMPPLSILLSIEREDVLLELVSLIFSFWTDELSEPATGCGSVHFWQQSNILEHNWKIGLMVVPNVSKLSGKTRRLTWRMTLPTFVSPKLSKSAMLITLSEVNTITPEPTGKTRRPEARCCWLSCLSSSPSQQCQSRCHSIRSSHRKHCSSCGPKWWCCRPDANKFPIPPSITLLVIFFSWSSVRVHLLATSEIESFTHCRTHLITGFAEFSWFGIVSSLSNTTSGSVDSCIRRVATPPSSTSWSHPSVSGATGICSSVVSLILSTGKQSRNHANMQSSIRCEL